MTMFLRSFKISNCLLYSLNVLYKEFLLVLINNQCRPYKDI